MIWDAIIRTMDDPICYEFRVISIATSTSVKCYSPKSLRPFLQGTLDTRPQVSKTVRDSCLPNTCNFFLGLLIRRICRLLSMCGIWLVGVSLVNCVLQLQKTNFGWAHKQYGILFHTQTFEICFNAYYVV